MLGLVAKQTNIIIFVWTDMESQHQGVSMPCADEEDDDN